MNYDRDLNWRIRIKKGRRTIREFSGNKLPISCKWDGKNEKGKFVKSGWYRYEISAWIEGEVKAKKVVGEVGLIFPQPARIEISPSSVEIWAGKKQKFTVKGYDENDNEVPLDASKVEWSTNNCGRMKPEEGIVSTFIASKTPKKNGIVTVEYRSLKDNAQVRVYPKLRWFWIGAERVRINWRSYHIRTWTRTLRDAYFHSWGSPEDYPVVWYEWYNCVDGDYFSSGTADHYQFERVFYMWDGVAVAVRGYACYYRDGEFPDKKTPKDWVFSNTIRFLD